MPGRPHTPTHIVLEGGLIPALFVRQVIICTKETSVGARKNAYTLLVEIGKAFVRFCDSPKGEKHVCHY